ncbi:copper resistance protein B [Sphingomonas laterariae]|uniref:Copper resistance protein B n=1 Tax=Edaphosphingomonas laterariae TaxID=861865 RepID=A0A239EDV7_9SPHN|nr:copper resistance protein B [Sphingomonas laterariae]SNS42960.1 copper resistance protein B [Sphingomonas laterariae]
MKKIAIALLITTATPALAQHAGHDMSGTQAADPHAGHNMDGAQAADPHAGHGMSGAQAADPHAGHDIGGTQAADPHAGHDMGGAQAADPHAGHDMSGTQAADPHAGHDMSGTQAADPHAGHDMGGAQAADPHAGHDMGGTQAADPHAGHNMGGTTANALPPVAPPPPGALSGPRHAADASFTPEAMAAARAQLAKEHGGGTAHMLMADRLEARIGDGTDAYLWDAQGWTGGDIDKLWVKTEGEGSFNGGFEEAEVQALWSHAVNPWFDLQTGIRTDFRRHGEDHTYAVFGIQGLAPYWFEIDAAAFLSDKGDLTARVEAEYDQRITQKLIVQPRIEFDLAAQDVPELGIGSGLSSIEAGVRLRYEFVREFAPYVGVEYERKIGDTADFARAEGEGVGGWRALIGLRAWF